MKLSEFFSAVSAPELNVSSGQLSSTSTTVPANPRECLTTLGEWPSIKKDIKKLIEPKMNLKFPELRVAFNGFTYNMNRRGTGVVDEKQVVVVGQNVYENTACDILQYVFNIDGVFSDHRTNFNVGDPDRVFVKKPEASASTSNDDGGNRPSRLVVEWKTPWAFQPESNIVAQYNEARNRSERNNKVVKAIHQLYGYMTFINLEFGVLCNYNSMFIFRRVDFSKLIISPEFRWSDTGLDSPLAALVYICHFVSQRGYFHYSPVDTPGPAGTQELRLDPELEYEGTWDPDHRVRWSVAKLELKKCISKGKACVIQGGVVAAKRKSRAQFNSHVAIIKIYDITDPENEKTADAEIAAYNRLKRYQGRYIPRVYAVGTVWDMLKVLVIEDCGVSAKGDRKTALRIFWKRARKAIRKLHRRHMIHGDIHLGNFTIDGNAVNETVIITRPARTVTETITTTMTQVDEYTDEVSAASSDDNATDDTEFEDDAEDESDAIPDEALLPTLMRMRITMTTIMMLNLSYLKTLMPLQS
ncbi:hypothetical protein H072_3923 [Dactylellina haptotyla CBS 200.50]|uniref:Protein kinase domain-containing protein n=1 Tax=Dactylellina haptotyla (strain CBS 200.50) TaxID=1284197 RepID=S8C362_DACHA|nr:hypothetical protein H072_3923 [Dactylellina haptotyla CBS 200.50]